VLEEGVGRGEEEGSGEKWLVGGSMLGDRGEVGMMKKRLKGRSGGVREDDLAFSGHPYVFLYKFYYKNYWEYCALNLNEIFYTKLNTY
jgi:hypothetical protein